MNVKSFYQGPIPTLEKLEKAIYIIAGGLLVVAAFAMLGKAVLSFFTAFSESVIAGISGFVTTIISSEASITSIAS